MSKIIDQAAAEDLVFGNLDMRDGPNPSPKGGDSTFGDDDDGDSGEIRGRNEPDDNDEQDAGDETPEGDNLPEDEEGDQGDGLDEPPARRGQEEPQRGQRQQAPGSVRGNLVLNADRHVVRQGTAIDRKGNVIDSKSGKIIARAGKERELFNAANTHEFNLRGMETQAERFRRQNAEAVNIGRELARRLEAAEKQPNVATEFGLTQTQHLEVLNFAKQYQADPVAAIKSILTRTAARGIDLSTITGSGSNPIDAKALVDMVREELRTGTKPIQEDAQRRESEQAQQREYQQVARATENFFADNPEAETFMPAFERALKDPRTSHMSLDEIWLRIQLHQARNPQRQQPRRGQREPERGRGRNNPGLPNGRTSLAPRGTRDERQLLDMSYDAILTDVLDDVGPVAARR